MQLCEERNAIFARLQTHLAKNDGEKQDIFAAFSCVFAKNACGIAFAYWVDCL